MSECRNEDWGGITEGQTRFSPDVEASLRQSGFEPESHPSPRMAGVVERAMNADTMTELPPLPAEPLDQFIDGLKQAAEDFLSFDPWSSQNIRSILLQIQKPRVVLVFGGHFKSGKSTTINAALNRPILPADDLPETGAICVIQAGESDNAQACGRAGARAIACTMEAIRQAISLVSKTGERRNEVHNVEQVDITLANCLIPPSVRWIDSPGINDTVEMNQNAQQAARAADVLLWVISSRQPLSEMEVDFLAAFIAERGPDAVIFLLNAFLQEDDIEAWQLFLNKKLPRLMRKVYDRAPALGLPAALPPMIVPIAARALCRSTAAAFGRDDLRQLLSEMDSSAHPRISRARLYQAGRALRRMISSIEEQLARETEKAGEYERRLRQQQESESRRADFARVIEVQLDHFLADWSARGRDFAHRFAATITAETLQRDWTYSWTLSQGIDLALEDSIAPFLKALAATIADYHHRQLSEEQIQELRHLLTPARAIVYVPATGASLVRQWAPQSWVRKFIEKDAAWSRYNVGYATEQVIAAMQARKGQALHFLIEAARPNALQSLEEPGSEELARRLKQMLITVSNLATQADSLAAWEKS